VAALTNYGGTIEDAAAMRHWPILMTTAAVVLGVFSVITASGAGRHNLGLVIAAGIGTGTFFTLFVVPAMYMLLVTDHVKQKARSEYEASFAKVHGQRDR
jgi:multidrug efflux pump